MKIRKRAFTTIRSAVCLAAMMCCMTSCGWNGGKNQDDSSNGNGTVQEGAEQTDTAGEEAGVELTQRQKDLLEQLGLPTEYDELTDSQKNAVSSIEDMLTYLEDKYEQSFSYLSYAAAGVLEEEHLEAYPSQGDLKDKVTVYRTYEDGAYQYEDDYRTVLLRPQYEKKVEDFAAQYFPGDSLKIYSEIKAVGEDADEENLLQNVSAVTYIFLDQSACEEGYDAFAGASLQWLEENCRGSAAGIYLRLTYPSAWEEISRYNYEEKIREDIFARKTECAVSESGKGTVNEAK